MAIDDADYEVRTARTVRGMEARTIAKWERDGWEVVSQDQDSLMRSTLAFRRKKRKSVPLLWTVSGAVIAAIVVTIGVLTEGGNTSAESAPVAASASATPSAPPSGQPSNEPSEEASNVMEQGEPSQSASAEPEPEKVLTLETSQELAALLAQPAPGGVIVEEFATKYQGKLIEFDGNIANMMNHGSYDSRYDMLIRSGDYSETSGTGPNFKFEDVSTFDLHLTGPNVPDHVGERDNFRFVARVLEYNSFQELLFLEPISTEMR